VPLLVCSPGGLLGGVFAVMRNVGKSGIAKEVGEPFVGEWRGGFVVDMVCIMGVLIDLTDCGAV